MGHGRGLKLFLTVQCVVCGARVRSLKDGRASSHQSSLESNFSKTCRGTQLVPDSCSCGSIYCYICFMEGAGDHVYSERQRVEISPVSG